MVRRGESGVQFKHFFDTPSFQADYRSMKKECLGQRTRGKHILHEFEDWAQRRMNSTRDPMLLLQRRAETLEKCLAQCLTKKCVGPRRQVALL